MKAVAYLSEEDEAGGGDETAKLSAAASHRDNI